ncbi:MAG: LacI family DNA-binding transcriptional regulator [Anaerolineae bacterium]|nr:LacI family DNA-binding transcriptional regulator [Anaerolineae bacterium]
MPTIKDVARQAGVSIATVSYVLNNRSGMVGAQTRQHVLEVARSLGYKANITARNLQSSRTSLIGYAWHRQPGNHLLVMDQFIYYLAHAAEAAGYHLLTFTHAEDDPVSVYEELIQSGRVDGFIVAETQQDDRRIAHLIQQQFPFVSFGRANPEWEFHWVDTDGQAGMVVATEYLLHSGHERIAFLGWPRHSLTGNDRLAGYAAALHRAGRPLREDYIIHNDYAHNSIDRAFEAWARLPRHEHPTAILAVSDYVALAAARTAEQYGFRVGATMSIVGFDDAPFVRFMQPALTTMRQPFEVICGHLVQQLDTLIRGEKPAQMTHLVTPELVIRESSCGQQNAPAQPQRG